MPTRYPAVNRLAECGTYIASTSFVTYPFEGSLPPLTIELDPILGSLTKLFCWYALFPHGLDCICDCFNAMRH